MCISDWSSDVCSSDLGIPGGEGCPAESISSMKNHQLRSISAGPMAAASKSSAAITLPSGANRKFPALLSPHSNSTAGPEGLFRESHRIAGSRSEEHTSELQSLMRISYAVFCLKQQKK